VRWRYHEALNLSARFARRRLAPRRYVALIREDQYPHVKGTKVLLVIRLLTTAAMILLILACRDGRSLATADGWVGTVDTLESGRIVVRNADVPLWGESAGWEVRERFRIGALEGDGPDVFGNITDVELGTEGGLYVLDGQASEIRVFGPDGEHLRTFGRAGQGPGELSRPAGMAFDSEGTLWVMNWGNARFSGFDPQTGELVDERRRLATFAMMPWPGRFNDSDRLLDVGLGSDGQPVVLGLNGDFVPQDTLALPQPDERHRILFRRGELPVMAAMIPFAPQPSWAGHPAGGIVVGEGEVYRLHRVSFSGDTLVTIEVQRQAAPVSREERDSALAAFRAVTQQQAGGATPDRQPRVPAMKPAHGAVFVDGESRIWVRQIMEPGAVPSWDVIDADGRLLGQISIPLWPTHVTPSVRGDRLAVVVSEDGVPGVVVFDLVRSRGAI
jgi:hypothetical protein